MGLFDFWKYSGREAAELADLTQKLAARTAADFFEGLADLASGVISTPLVSGTTSQRATIPEGWYEVDPRDMGFTESEIGYNNYIKVNSPTLGDVDGTVQVKVFRSHDGGFSISWAATNNPIDVVDFFTLNSGETGPLMDKALTKIAQYAQSIGVAGADVLVTGYSLGGAYTVNMAQNQKTLAGGYFDQATYVSHNGPLVDDSIENLMSYGTENDIVYRAIGQFDTVQGALDAAGPLLEGSDFNFDSSIDNVIVFDGAFASPLFPFAPFSILNIAGGWYNHITSIFSDAVQRIGDSAFYELTNRDTAMVVSALGADLRSTTWVIDKVSLASTDHFGKSAHIVGTLFGDKLHDGAANDFMSGMAGDDLIRVTDGMDMIDGGEGRDTLRLMGDAKDWDVYRLSDGTLAFASDHGLKLATSIERVEFEGLTIGRDSLINDSYLVKGHELYAEGSWFERWFKSDKAYAHATEGSDGADVLSGQVVFGRDGADRITGTASDDLLSGDAGKDILRGGAGDDRMYGGAQNDVLISDGGDDILNGGHGTDVFAFVPQASGHVVVEDFNRAMGETDRLFFAGHASTVEQLHTAATQTDAGVTLALGDLTIELQDATLDMLTADTVSFA